MASTSVSAGKELTKVQQRMLQAAIDEAVASGIFFRNVDEMTDYLRTEGVSENLLDEQHLKVRVNMWLGSTCPILTAGRVSTTAAGRPPSPPYSEPTCPAPSLEAPDQCPVSSGEDSGDLVVTFHAEHSQRSLLISMSRDNGMSWDGLSSRLCQQDGNFITLQAATRLHLRPAIGTKHKLLWYAQKGAPDQKTRPGWFTVVRDDAMDVDVGLNWLYSEDAVDDQDDVVNVNPSNVRSGSMGASTHSRPRHHPSSDPETADMVQPWLSGQDQAMVPHVHHYPNSARIPSEIIRVHDKFLDVVSQFGAGFSTSPPARTPPLSSGSVLSRHGPPG